MPKLEAKVALITGSAHGMGKAEALLFAREGAKVIVADISEDGERLAGEIGANALYVPLDVTSEESWAAAVDASMRAFGAITVLVNNAGAFVSAPILSATTEDFERITRTNQLGVLLGMKAIAPSMKIAGGGSIVNISSLAAFRPAPNQAIYAASKWAVRGLTRVAASELSPLNIRVNSVHPGAINTRLLELNPPGFNEMVASMTPLKRLGEPEDVAKAVLFLASDDAAFITGAELVIDGGLGIT